MINLVVPFAGLSPYGLCPAVPGDPSTPRLDGSQVKFSSFFNSEFKFLLMSQTFMLQGSHTSPTPVMPWGGSPTTGQTSTWLPSPPAGYWPTSPLGRYWPPSPPARHLGQSSSTPPHHRARDTSRHGGHLHLEGKSHLLLHRQP
jgi:hypothetical protein